MIDYAFIVVAAVMLLAGYRVVAARNLVHTVLWLGLMLSGTAAAFVLLGGPFLAAIQLMLYTGGILTLMLFGIMLTRRKHTLDVPNEQHHKGRGALLAGGLFAVMAAAILKTDLGAFATAGPAISTKALGESFLTTHLLAFEVLSVLLLAAVIGAIVLARPKDPAPEGEDTGPRIPARQRLPERRR